MVRREKKPNLELFPGLGAGAGAGNVAECWTSRSACMSGVCPRTGARELEDGCADGFGEGSREEGFGAIMVLDRDVNIEPVRDSEELVLRCEVGKLLKLL